MCSTQFNDGTVVCQCLLPAPFTKHQGCLPDPRADEKQYPPLKCAEGFVSNLSFFFKNTRQFSFYGGLLLGFVLSFQSRTSACSPMESRA